MSRLLAFGLALLLTPVIAKADFIIDTFDSATDRTGDGSGITRQATGVFDFNTSGSVGLRSQGLSDPSGNLVYTFATPVFLTSTDFFVRGLERIAEPSVSYVVTVTTSGGTYSSGPRLVPSGPLDETLDMSGALALNQMVTSVTLSADNPNNLRRFTVGAIAFDASGVVPVPEPLSLALAGLAVTSMGGVRFVRRRRQAVAV